MLKKFLLKHLIIFTIIFLAFLPIHFKFFEIPRLNLINAGSVNPDPSFTPNNLIFDNDFINTSSMSASEIQAFLEKFNSPLANTNPDFLKRFCGTPVSQCNNTKTAAQLIYEAATLIVDGQPRGVNPGVILVTLQKEQGLITKTSWNDSCPAGNNCSPGTLQYALDWAMGYSVYEDGTRIQELKGFKQQLLGVPNSYWGAPRSLRYNFESGLGPYNTHFGDGFWLTNDTSYYNVPSSQYVKPENRATLALYRYTPHVFNGNYNFWYYWNYWFGSIYNIEVSSQISFSPTTNWYYVDGNIVWIDFGIKNKNKISMKLERIKVDIWDSRGYQDIYGVSDYVLEPGENFLLSDSGAFRKKIFKYPANYTAQIWIKYRGKWYLPKGAQTKNFRVIPMQWNYFYLNPNLSLNPSQIYEGQSTTANFTIYNKTSAPLYLERLKVDVRDGTKNYDITGYSGYTLNNSFNFSQPKTINEAGTYTAGVRVRINGKWFIPSGNVDKEIKVLEKVKALSMVSQLNLNSYSLKEGNILEANFSIKNNGDFDIFLQRLKIDVRGTGDPQDIVGISNFTIRGGETFNFSSSTADNKKILNSTGTYNAIIWAKYNNSWYQIQGAESKRLKIDPISYTDLYLNPNLSLNPSQIYEGQSTTANFTIYNKTSAPLYLERLKVDVRDGTKNYDITGYSGYTLNNSFNFSQPKTINEAGTYTAGVRVRINGKWFIPSGNVDKEIKVLEK